jgi:spermidine synthase
MPLRTFCIAFVLYLRSRPTQPCRFDMTATTEMPNSTQYSAHPSSVPAAHPFRATVASLYLFAATLFSSAFLLFAVQPMFAKLLLPQLGGAPSVWAVSMCFFQAVLLAGYCYAHLLNRHVNPRVAIIIHLALLIATLLVLPIGLTARLGQPPQGDAYIWLIGALALGVGLPFFAVSANAPLLQAWFARTGHPAARDPYFLYGASNIGSLLALISYPLLIEPTFGVSTQTRSWTVGFMLLALLIAGCGVAMTRLSTQRTEQQSHTARDAVGALSWQQRAVWLLLSALPSGLLVAVTTLITTDIASAPFIWAIPLALFLASFVMTFKAQVSRHFPLLGYVLPLAALCASMATQFRFAAALIAFFGAALVCHRELYLRRPHATQLTSFYLWMSFGGAVGGLFSALLAPQVFTTTAEFQWLLAACLFCVPGLIFGAPHALDGKRIAGIACLAFACLAARGLASEISGVSGQQKAAIFIICGIMATLILARNWPEVRVLFMIGVALVMLTLPEAFRPLFAERSFFGTVRVVETADAQHRIMMHGTTLHGSRRIKTPAGDAVNEPMPAAYYHPLTPLARGFDVVRRAKNADGDARVLAGIVGLGTGSLACYMRPGDAFRFFEIDPVVAKIAATPKHFDFLSTCAPNAPVIIGDARLTLAKEPDDVFDYLVIDAFSSDSVPTHLLTVEAIKLYMAKLADNGLLALHISNRYVDLVGAIGSTLSEINGAQAAIVRFTPPVGTLDAKASHVVLISKNSRTLDDVMTWTDAEGLARSSARAWTDDYANVLAAIWRKAMQ